MPGAKWALGIIVCVAMSYLKKGLRIEDGLEKVVETAATVAEVVAEVTERVAADMASALPDGEMKREILEFEKFAEELDKDAKKVKEYIHKTSTTQSRDTQHSQDLPRLPDLQQQIAFLQDDFLKGMSQVPTQSRAQQQPQIDLSAFMTRFEKLEHNITELKETMTNLEQLTISLTETTTRIDDHLHRCHLCNIIENRTGSPSNSTSPPSAV